MRLNFTSGGLRCAASLFRPTDRSSALAPCVVMAHGFTGTRDQLIVYAEAFARAGLAVLTFDYRHFGDSEGSPRQIVSLAAGIYDEVRGLVGLSPHYIDVFGRPGQVAAFTDPEWESHLAIFARGPTWRNEFAPRFLFRTPKYVHGTAERIPMPLLVCVAEQDTEANPELAIDIARKRRGVS